MSSQGRDGSGTICDFIMGLNTNAHCNVTIVSGSTLRHCWVTNNKRDSGKRGCIHTRDVPILHFGANINDFMSSDAIIVSFTACFCPKGILGKISLRPKHVSVVPGTPAATSHLVSQQ